MRLIAMMPRTLSRRTFLELGGLAAAGWALSPGGLHAQSVPSPDVARSLVLRLGYQVRDVSATARFWSVLGAVPVEGEGATVMRLGGIHVVLTPRNPSASSDGSVVNHIAFRVPAFDQLSPALTAAGIRIERPAQFPGTLNAFTPDGDKVEIFSNASTSPGFTPDGQTTDVTWQRHNTPVDGLSGHHLHFYVPEGQDRAAQAWYVARFGGTPGVRLRYAAVDYPGINLNFSTAAGGGTMAPTAGRSLDRIGFRVRDLEALCRHITQTGSSFDRVYAKGPDGHGTALLTDPWGTLIELTDGSSSRGGA
jgi:catechol 2,3-dioxygenase-like lactoylglutathione lyase family enzyme